LIISLGYDAENCQWRRAMVKAGESFGAQVSHVGELDIDYSRFPKFQCSIGYGSGVFRQDGYDLSKRPMVDLLLVVDDEDLEAWHHENLKSQPEHYSSFARFLGTPRVCQLQHWGPGVFYLPEVELATTEGGVLNAKYGVITWRDLLRDLENWSSLYIAGRMQKPFVHTWHNDVVDAEDTFDAAVDQNRRAALASALLSAGQECLDVSTLLTSVVGLSYGGDIRVGLAENPNKVRNIVNAQKNMLWDIYRPLAEDLEVDVSEASLDEGLKGVVRFDNSRAGLQRLFTALPEAVRRKAAEGGVKEPWGLPLRRHVQATVRRASMQQAVKGVLSSGFSRSLRYVLQKVAKRIL